MSDEHGELKVKSIGQYARRAAPIPLGSTYDAESDVFNCSVKSERIKTVRLATNIDVLLGADSGEIVGLRIFEVKALIAQLFEHLANAVPNIASELQTVRDLIVAMLSNPIVSKSQPLSKNATVPDTVDFRRLLRSKVAEEKLPLNFAQAA